LGNPTLGPIASYLQQEFGKVAFEINQLVEDIKGVCNMMRRWYHEKGGHVTKPTQHDKTKTRQENETLFTAEEPPGQDITINIDPFSIDDNTLDEEEIK
jgi:hypothetical protein